MFELRNISKRFGLVEALRALDLTIEPGRTAVLALLVQGLFELIDRLVVPKGLRLKRSE